MVHRFSLMSTAVGFLRSRLLLLSGLALVVFLTLAIPHAANAYWNELSYGDTICDWYSEAPGDTWVFYGTRGDWVDINMFSEDFDTYLRLYDPSGRLIRSNDDSGYGTDSNIYVSYLTRTGYYSIKAQSYSGFGSYCLTLE